MPSLSRDLHRFYHSAAWKRTRLVVLERDNHRCVTCGRHAETVHHVPSVAELTRQGRDPLDPDTCVALCHACHGSEDATRQNAKPKRVNRFMTSVVRSQP